MRISSLCWHVECRRIANRRRLRWRIVRIYRRGSEPCSIAGSGAAGRGRCLWRQSARLARPRSPMMSPLTMAADASAFEVASIKLNKSGATRAPSMILPGGRFTATNNTVRALILNAYGIFASPSLLSGGPGWIDSEAYDIDARAEANAIPANILGKPPVGTKTRLMLRAFAGGSSSNISMHPAHTKRNVDLRTRCREERAKTKRRQPGLDAANVYACHGFSGSPRRLTGTGIDT